MERFVAQESENRRRLGTMMGGDGNRGDTEEYRRTVACDQLQILRWPPNDHDPVAERKKACYQCKYLEANTPNHRSNSYIRMHTVGHHLQTKALATLGPDRDSYARSAFNRYYYGAFLTIRSMFREMDSKWYKLPHAAYPEILSGQITRAFQTAERRAHKNGDSGFVYDIARGKRAIAALRQVISTAGELRKIADYRPEESVEFTDASRFSLRTVEVTVAHNWKGETDLLCRNILAVWKQIHV